MDKPVLFVVAAGPGVSGSVARRFGREGYDAALVGLDETVLEELAAVPARRRHAGSVEEGGHHGRRGVRRRSIRASARAVGRIDVLHFNPSAFRHEDAVGADAGGARCGRACRGRRRCSPPYRPRGRSCEPAARITATGSMAADKPWNEAASLGVQKAGLRNLIHSIDTTLKPEGIRAVSVTVRGTLGREGPFTPDRVAEAIFAAAAQDEDRLADRDPLHGLI